MGHDCFLLHVFTGYCGHEWVGSENGAYACPVCGAGDGDHNIKASQPIAVQLDDFESGDFWRTLARASRALSGCPTREQIKAGMSPAGGWERKTLAEWGVPWPPPRGWKKRLERQADQIDADA